MKKDILIVDDEEDILTMLSHVFTDLGWEPYVAKKALDAIELFKRVQPPLVLTDLLLHDGVGGAAVCKEIKNIAPITICVAMSGYYQESYSVSHLRRCGFDSLTEKPLLSAKCKQISEFAECARKEWDELIK